MPSLNDPTDVAREYAGERGLLARRSLYAGLEGQDIKEVLFVTVRSRSPESVLEVGAGTGELAQRLMADGIRDYRAIDISPRMVELTRSRGVPAEVGDVQALQFDDERFGCVVAAWMLYHVPDLDQGLSEIARVLAPGGCLIAATNSVKHLQELWSPVGYQRWALPFTQENGGAILDRHFAEVHTHRVEAWVTLENGDAVCAYITASPTRAYLADRVPKLREPLRVAARTCIFVATKR